MRLVSQDELDDAPAWTDAEVEALAFWSECPIDLGVESPVNMPDTPQPNAPPITDDSQRVIDFIQSIEPITDDHGFQEHLRIDERIRQATCVRSDIKLWQGTHSELAKRALCALARDEIIPRSDAHISSGDLAADFAAAQIRYTDGALWRYDEASGIWAEVPSPFVVAAIDAFDGQPYGHPKKDGTHTPFHMTIGVLNSIRSLMIELVGRSSYFTSVRLGGLAVGGRYYVARKGSLFVQDHSHHNRLRHAYPFEWYSDPHAYPIICSDDLAQKGPLDALWSPLCPVWMWLLGNVLSGREDEASAIQEWLGAVVCGVVTQYQTAMLFVGAGGNGKGTILKAFAQLMPPGSVSATNPGTWKQDYHRGVLFGKMLNILTETAAFETPDTLKAVITGDQLEARRIGGDPFTYSPIAGHAFSCNDLPRTRLDKALEGRFVIIRFDRSFRGSSSQISEARILAALEKERSGILLWALAGMVRLSGKSAITHPAISASLIREWGTGTSLARRFIADRCEVVSGAIIDAALLYNRFRAWCMDVEGIPQSKVPPRTAFTEDVKSEHPVDRIGAARTRYYRNLKMSVD